MYYEGEKMTVKEVLKVCADFISAPEDKEKVAAYDDMCQKLTVRSYLTMQEKVIALVRIVIDSDKDYDVPASFFTAGVEMACLFDGLISYTNLEQDLSIEEKNYENYDLLYQSGFADYVLGFCQKDYNRLVCMMERTFSFENLMELTSSIKEMDVGALDNLTNELRNCKKDLDPEILRDLADILRYNDSNLSRLKEVLGTESLDKVLGKKDE